MRALVYDELDSFLDDQARLTAAELLGPMSGEARREPSGQAYFVLHAGSFVETADDARQPAWMTGLRFKRELAPTVGSYWDFLRQRGNRMGGAIPADRSQTGSASLSVNLPDHAVQGLVTHVLTNADASVGIWRFEIAAKVVARHTRPLHKMPQSRIGFELRMHRLSAVAGAPDHVAMLAANHALLPLLQAADGKVYPPYCPILSAQQWQEHYGAETWRRFAAAKKRFDPNNVLTPGAGIF